MTSSIAGERDLDPVTRLGGADRAIVALWAVTAPWRKDTDRRSGARWRARWMRAGEGGPTTVMPASRASARSDSRLASSAGSSAKRSKKRSSANGAITPSRTEGSLPMFCQVWTVPRGDKRERACGRGGDLVADADPHLTAKHVDPLILALVDVQWRPSPDAIAIAAPPSPRQRLGLGCAVAFRLRVGHRPIDLATEAATPALCERGSRSGGD
jgi:SLT domain-containing protein